MLEAIYMYSRIPIISHGQRIGCHGLFATSSLSNVLQLSYQPLQRLVVLSSTDQCFFEPPAPLKSMHRRSSRVDSFLVPLHVAYPPQYLHL